MEVIIMNKKIDIKNKNIFKSKWQMLIYILLFAIIIYLFILIGTKDYNSTIPDSELISEKFSMLEKDNIYEYANASVARMVASGTKGIVLFGTDNEWVNYYASIVNDIAKNMGINKIYYYDFTDNRDNNNATYEDILNKLNNYVVYNDYGTADIYAPTLLIVAGGKVIYFDSETSFISGNITPKNYWTNEKRQEKSNELIEVFLKYLES